MHLEENNINLAYLVIKKEVLTCFAKRKINTVVITTITIKSNIEF